LPKDTKNYSYWPQAIRASATWDGHKKRAEVHVRDKLTSLLIFQANYITHFCKINVKEYIPNWSTIHHHIKDYLPQQMDIVGHIIV